jgi:hypothetical protein
MFIFSLSFSLFRKKTYCLLFNNKVAFLIHQDERQRVEIIKSITKQNENGDDESDSRQNDEKEKKRGENFSFF